MKDTTYIPNDYLEEMDCLSDAEFGRLIRWLLLYSKTGKQAELKGTEKVFLKRVKNQEDKYARSYAEKCATNAQNGAKGGRPRKANGFEENPENQTVILETEKSQSKVNKSKVNKSKAKNNPPKSPQGDAFGGLAGDDKALFEALTAFAEMRKTIKAPMTERAKQMLVNKLQTMSGGDHAVMIQLLDQSTEKCWKDVYPLKNGSVTANTSPPVGTFVPGAAEAASVARLERFAAQLRAQPDNAELDRRSVDDLRAFLGRQREEGTPDARG